MNKTQVYLDDLNRVLHFIERADNKAEVLLSIAGAMAGLVGVAQGIVNTEMLLCKIFIIMSIIGYMASILYSLSVVYPRLVPDSYVGSHIYFDTATKLERKNKGSVKTFYENISDAEYDKELIEQIVENNRVAEAKFGKIKFAVFYLAVAISFTCASIITFNVR